MLAIKSSKGYCPRSLAFIFLHCNSSELCHTSENSGAASGTDSDSDLNLNVLD